MAELTTEEEVREAEACRQLTMQLIDLLRGFDPATCLAALGFVCAEQVCRFDEDRRPAVTSKLLRQVVETTVLLGGGSVRNDLLSDQN